MSNIDKSSCASSATSSDCEDTLDEESGWEENETNLTEEDGCKRRRLLIMHKFVVVCATACFALDGTPGHVTASYKRQRANFEQLCMKMKAGLFLRSFRMRAPAFHALYHMVADDLHKDPVQASRSSG